MKLTVNGEPHRHDGDGSIAALLGELGAKKEHAALMLNGEVLPSREWNRVRLREGDVVELLVFVGGG